MSSFRRPPVIALDGNHRVGKGTQLDILSYNLANEGYAPIILRGDGTRSGSGETEGDPESGWWKNFKNFEKSHLNPYEAWREGACRLLSEAAIRLSEVVDNGIILFDRAGISRAQMTLKEGLHLTMESMYGSESDADYVNRMQPDLTIYMSAPTEVLLERLDSDDEKYEFRRKNIIESNPYFDKAFKLYKKLGIGAVTAINADAPLEVVANEIRFATMNAIHQAETSDLEEAGV